MNYRKEALSQFNMREDFSILFDRIGYFYSSYNHKGIKEYKSSLLGKAAEPSGVRTK